MGKLSDVQRECLSDIYFENDRPPEEKWFERAVWDPMHTMATLRSLASKKLVELEMGEEFGGGCRFRFTHAGRAALASAQDSKG